MDENDPKGSVELLPEKTQPSIQTPRDRLIGKKIAGRYTIERRLARGGMGVVYLANHETLKRTVVFKVLSTHVAGDESAIARFQREATGLSQLNHPHIVTVFDYGHDEVEDLTYLVMEFIEGETLGKMRKRVGGHLTFDEFLPIATQTLDAVAAAHERGIVHRDIKPANIMVSDNKGRPWVKVLDFGLARNVTSSVDITQGKLVGTVSYIAPEIVQGAKGDEQSDVYALGVMFYYLLAGKKPFDGADDMSVLYQHVNADPEPLSNLLAPGDVPEGVVELIHRAMSKKPADRPRDGRAFVEALADLVSYPSFSRSYGGFSVERTPAPQRVTPFPTSGDQTRADLPSARHPSEERQSQPSIIVQQKPNYVLMVLGALLLLIIGYGGLALFDKARQKPDPVQVGTTAPPTPTPVEPEPRNNPASPTATLAISSTPSGSIQIDGIDKGPTPATLEVNPGRHLVRIEAEGHEPFQQWYDIVEGDSQTIDATLSAVEVTAPDVGAAEPRPAPQERRTARPSSPKTQTPRAKTKQPKPAPPNTSKQKDEPKEKKPFYFGTPKKKGEKGKYFK